MPDVFHAKINITMESDEIIRNQILETIKNQLNDNKPPETKITYNRLRKEGFDDYETKQMIGQCVAVEIFNALKFGKPYDNKRYIKNLKRLPKEPFDE